jgi:Ala-tRNA(Pro) deacylase
MDKLHPYNSDNILEYMKNIGIATTLYHHPPVFTVAEAERVDKEIEGAHTRNLFLRDKREKMFLVTLRHDTKVDLKKLSDLLGCGRFSFGSPERLWTYLGVRPGSVTPLSILNDTDRKVQIVLEYGMMNEEKVNFHPLNNAMTVGMTPADLMTILEKENITPIILDLSLVAPDNTETKE